ncbi:hypothetical protein [Methylobrevis pamukkalensis]|uniref:HAMP domain-containing protein n=1 Tax=Methylobrevis pamukkalensis TaxID=1439726 RepID=A0A1E3H3L3_9HYPH|nr:hypothetical protein [Methylobrevis pamukkalensis]ODN70913.1 hypothetical protein A6302_01757 [Methylobrevis pamukkalensis]
MTAAGGKRTPLLRAVSATLFVSILVFAATLAVCAGLVMAAERTWLAEETTRLRESSIALLRSAIDPRYQTKSEEVSRVGSRLVVIDALKGASIFDETGTVLESFGERPHTTFAALRHGVVPAPESPEEARAEFHIAPVVTETPFHLLLRVDTTPMRTIVARNVARLRLAALVISLVAAAVAAMVVQRRIARPARRIAAVLAAAIEHPEAADRQLCAMARSDEIGRMARNIDSFLTQIAAAWRTRVMVADALLSNAPTGLVQVSAGGALLSANPAAERLLALRYGDDGLPLPTNLRMVDSGERMTLTQCAGALREGSRLVEALESRVPTFMLADAVKAGSEEAGQSTVILLTDVTSLQRSGQESAERAGLAEREIRERARRQLELKLMLESCLALLAPSPSGPDEHIDPLPLAVNWIRDAQAAGLVGEADVSLEGPIVSGAAADVEAIVRLGLLSVFARAGSTPVRLVVEGKGINFETAGYTFRAYPPAAAQAHDDGSASAADWQLALAALRTAVKRVRGQVSEFASTEDETSVRVILRGATERVHTGLASSRQS